MCHSYLMRVGVGGQVGRKVMDEWWGGGRRASDVEGVDGRVVEGGCASGGRRWMGDSSFHQYSGSTYTH